MIVLNRKYLSLRKKEHPDHHPEVSIMGRLGPTGVAITVRPEGDN